MRELLEDLVEFGLGDECGEYIEVIEKMSEFLKYQFLLILRVVQKYLLQLLLHLVKYAQS